MSHDEQVWGWRGSRGTCGGLTEVMRYMWGVGSDFQRGMRHAGRCHQGSTWGAQGVHEGRLGLDGAPGRDRMMSRCGAGGGSRGAFG